jgi:thymidylate synthase (FAD)
LKIIAPSFNMMSPGHLAEGIEMLRRIEYFGRISHRSEEKQTPDSWQRFIQAVVVDHGDLSIIEHCGASVVFRIDRAICMEMVRHRLFSYTMESTRFVNGRKSYPNGLEFIHPENFKQPQFEIMSKAWERSCRFLEEQYFLMLEHGARPQEARSVLPNALAATIAVSGNLRNWRHFFLMRTSKETHPDFRRVTIPLLAEFKNRVPILFDDIEPEARQIDNLKKAR